MVIEVGNPDFHQRGVGFFRLAKRNTHLVKKVSIAGSGVCFN